MDAEISEHGGRLNRVHAVLVYATGARRIKREARRPVVATATLNGGIKLLTIEGKDPVSLTRSTISARGCHERAINIRNRRCELLTNVSTIGALKDKSIEIR